MRQPSQAHVEKMHDQRKSAMNLLKRFADCLSKEASSWLANVQALQKAQKEEQAATKREQDKEAKRLRKLEEKEQAKQAKELEKQRKKDHDALEKEKNQEDPEKPEEPDEDPKKARKRRTGYKDELNDSDPMVLQEMSKFDGAAIAITDDVKGFVQEICEDPHVASIGRLKRSGGMFKKVLSEQGGHSSKEITAIQKILVSQGTEFQETAFRAFQDPNCMQPRTQSTQEGPADALALDRLLATGIEEANAKGKFTPELILCALDRADIEKRKLADSLHLHIFLVSHDSWGS